ncbi:pyridoxamine 5'-phosphate oxidase family protein [Lachnospiraceae bacterium ZAX-1]
MSKVVDFLNEAKVYYLATVEDNQPRVRPFGATAEFNGKVYFCTNNEKNVFKQLLNNPKIEISGMVPDGRWIRITAEAVVDDNDEARKAMLAANPNLASIYTVNDGKFEVFYIDDVKAIEYSFTGEPVVLEG